MIAHDVFNRSRDPKREIRLRQQRDWIGNTPWLDLWHWYMEFRHPWEAEPCPTAGRLERFDFPYKGAIVWMDCYPDVGLVVPVLQYFHTEERWAEERVRDTQSLIYAFEPQPTADTASTVIRDAWSRHSMRYAAYLQTAWWKQQRQLVLGAVENKKVCSLCHGTSRLNVHHNTYARRGFEEDEDLIVLCRRCHTDFHSAFEADNADLN